MGNILFNKIKEYAKMMETSGRKFDVTKDSNDNILLLVPLDRVGHMQQPIYIATTSSKDIKFSAPIPEIFKSKNDIPKRLEKAIMERNKNQLFTEKWVIEDQTEFFCFTLTTLVSNPMLADMVFLEKTIYGIIQECLWFYNNYEQLARRLRVFISYAKEDKVSAEKLRSQLTREGIDVWIDEKKLMGGKDWKLEIQKEIRDSHIILILLSTNAVTKIGFIQKEIKIALDYADEHPEGVVFLIPVRLDDCEVPTRISERFQWVDLFKANGYKKLIESLSDKANLLGFSLEEAKKVQTLKNKVNKSNVIVNKELGMDEHENAIHELCVKHANKDIDDRTCLAFVSHLTVTQRPARSTLEIIEQLSIKSQIEIVAHLLAIEEKGRFLDEVNDCITVFINSDEQIGQILRYRIPPDKVEEYFDKALSDIMKMSKLRSSGASRDEISRETISIIKDKKVYSYQTFLEIELMRKKAWLAVDDERVYIYSGITNFILQAISLTSQESLFNCPKCGLPFKTGESLKMHIANWHK